MLKTKSTKMRQAVERKLNDIETQLVRLTSLTSELGIEGSVFESLVAQKVILQEVLNDFEKMGV